MKTIPIEKIIAEGTTQARQYDEKLAQRYAEQMKDGAVFPPIVVFHDKNGYYLADGFHRRGAAQLAGRTELAADIHGPINGESAQRSAILHAVGSNDEHGQNRSPADKRHAVEMVLRDPEWSKWTDREIGRQCRVGAPFVGQQRQRLINAGALKKTTTRKAKRNGKDYEVDTARIGKSSRKPAEKPPITKEQKKVAREVKRSVVDKQEGGWTKADEDTAAKVLDALHELGKAWEKATRPAQIHTLEVIRKTLRTMS